jgi:hypothetical protein
MYAFGLPTFAQHIVVLVAPATMVGLEGAGRCSMFITVKELADKCSTKRIAKCHSPVSVVTYR